LAALCAADAAQAEAYEQQAAQEEWVRQAHHYHEQEQAAWEPGEYEAMLAEVEGY
jgi:hypothetical protein